MEQEEEWEREGLLDPAWEKQQKKVISPTKYSTNTVFAICAVFLFVTFSCLVMEWSPRKTRLDRIYLQ